MREVYGTECIIFITLSLRLGNIQAPDECGDMIAPDPQNMLSGVLKPLNIFR